MPSSGTAEAPKAPKHDKVEVQETPEPIEALVERYNRLSGNECGVSIYMETRFSQEHSNIKYMKHYGIVHRRGLGIEEAKKHYKYKTPEAGLDRTSDVETLITSELNEYIENATTRQTRSKTRSKSGR